MITPNPRRPQIEHAGHQSSTNTTRVSEIAIQADRDGDSDGEDNSNVREFDFQEPFLFSDATLVVQNRKLYCHRAILSLFSPVFKAMFQNRCIENQKNEVVISGDSYEDLREILTHMYTPGGCDMSAESAQKLISILHRYQMDHLVNQAERAMAFRLTDSTASGCLQVADMYGLTKLRQAALETCARLDAERLHRVFKETQLSSELRTEILEKRVALLEKCLVDIQNSFTHSCTRVENRMERVASNHCTEHTQPMTQIILTPPPPLPLPTAGNEPVEGIPPSGVEVNSQPSRSEVSASIEQAASALGSVTMRPLDNNLRPNASRTNLNNMGTNTAAPVPTLVCDKCADRLKTHIVDLCKRGLHKIPIVMMRDT